MQSVLIYYPFQMAEQVDSGSKVRPREMIHAFRRWGQLENVKILVISGTSKERDEAFRELLQKGELEELLFCYAENQTIPIWLTDPKHIPKKPLIDQQVFAYLKKRKIPIGIFYRDVYWKFDRLYPLRGVKKKIMQMIYRREERFYEKYMDVIFLPSDEMGRYVDITRTKVALPPGGKDLSPPVRKEIKDQLQAIFVGAVGRGDSGVPLMMQSLELAQQQGDPFQLHVVCREKEYQSLDPQIKQRMGELGIQIHHLFGSELDRLYTQMDFAFIPNSRSEYNDFAVPVKLVEYLSNRLPIVATDCTAQKRIIESGPYGLICEADPASMVEAVRNMQEEQSALLQHIEQNFLKDHSWLARVWTVKKSLMK